MLPGVTLVPVPRNKAYSDKEGELKTYEYFKNLIEARSTDPGQ